MPWVIFAAAVWLIILIFLRVSLGKYWSAGLWTLFVGFFMNNFFTKYNFFLYKEILYPIKTVPAAYLFGLAGVGIIIVSFLPEGRAWQLLYLILLSILFAGIGLFAESRGYLTYLHWTLYDSFGCKLFALIVITWLSDLTVKRRKSGYFINRGIF